MAQVEVRAVRKSFDGQRLVLDGVSFTAQDGEFVSLLGASGCGKSTLLRTVAGLETADEGRILIGGKEVSSLSPKDRDIAMVFQNYALYPHLNVRENIEMGLKLRKTPTDEITRRVADAAGRLGLTELLSRRPAALSGGQRQRVALARALVRHPQVYLLDEPLSNLDAVLRERTRGELKLLFKRVNGTVLYVTHDQVEAMTMSDRVVVLDGGRVQQNGSPEDIYFRPANTFVAGFLGAPPMNILPAEAAAKAGLVARAEPGRLLGVRPEDVRLASSDDGGRKAAVILGEPTGATTVLTLELGGVSLRAAVPGNWGVNRPEAWIGLPADKLHWFDAQTGARL